MNILKNLYMRHKMKPHIINLQYYLKSYNKKITIIGHDNIDVDAFLSGILLSNFLTFLGIENEFLILEEVKENETYRIIKDVFNIDMKDYMCKEEDDKRLLFLEDHYKTSHKGKVIHCIDHHPSEEKVNYRYHITFSCSTSYLIYEYMMDAGYKISRQEAEMILFSMMIDTLSFRNGKTVYEQTLVAKKIAEEHKLNYEEIEKYCLCLTPIQKMSVDEIINNGYKYYNYNGNKVKSSYIQVDEMPSWGKINSWALNIEKKIKEESLEMWVFIIIDCKNNETYEYRLPRSHPNSREIKHKGILSRGTNIMPRIEKMFSK